MPALTIPVLHPKLYTKRLELREITLEDREEIYAIYSDERITDEHEMTPLLSIHSAEHLIIDWQEAFAHKEGIRWGVCTRDEPRLVGTCGFTRWAPAMQADIVYDLGRDCWGQGLMTEAMQAVLCYGFEDIGLNRIEALVSPGNERSIHLLNRLGFQREGLLRQYGYWKGKFWDQICYSMLAEDWQSSPTPPGLEA